MKTQKPKALDLFCGEGGAADGLIRAGFNVTGMDIIDHSAHYPGKFILQDITQLPHDTLDDFDFVFASPPCQAFSFATYHQGTEHKKKIQNLIPITRQILKRARYSAIENVPQAPIRKDLTLTGPTFGLWRIERKRIFELSFMKTHYQIPIIHIKKHMIKSGHGICITTSLAAPSHFYPRKKIGLPGTVPIREAMKAMGIEREKPMTKHGIGNAIPPAYTQYIGEIVRRNLEQKHK